MYLPVVLLIVVVASLRLLWRRKNRALLKAAEQFPGPKTLPGLGNAMMFMCSPEETVNRIKKLLQDYGDVLRFWLGPDLNIIVGCPDDIKILLTNSKLNYKGPQYKYMADVLGGGILSGSGSVWRRHRKIANPNFSKRATQNYGHIFNREVGLLVEELRKKPMNEEFDIYKDVVKTTTYVVCQTVMGLTKEQTMSLPHLQEIIDKSPSMYKIVFDRMIKWYLQIDPIFWMTSYFRDLKHFIKIMDNFGSSIMKYREEHLKTIGEDIKLKHMEMKEDVTFSVIDRFLLSDFDKDTMVQETFTLFTASQEATAKIASYLLLMLAYHPDCQEKLYNEIKSVIGDCNRDVTDDDLKDMPYLEMVFKEIIRMFPIGAMLQRTVTEDVAIKSGYLPTGSSLTVSIFHLHRDPRFWNNPVAFDPERFNPENTARRPPNAYIPFSLGPMDCLGRHFGTKLVKTLCTRLLHEYELTSLQSYKDLRLTIRISVVSLDGYKVLIKRRRN